MEDAELGVVNIITKGIDDIDGVAFSSSFSEMKETFGQRNLSMSIGKKINDFDIVLHSSLGVANRSDREYTGFNSDYSGFSSYSMKDYSKINSMNVNLSINNNKFKNHLLIDQYSTKVKDAFDVVTPAFYEKYNTLIWKSEYEYDISDKIKLTPEVTYKKQSPWENKNIKSKSFGIFSGIETQRVTAKATFNINLTDKINIITGLELYNEDAYTNDSTEYFHSQNELDSVTYNINYNNYVAFAQGEIKTKYANILIGARLENNSAVGTSFVPRIAATKAFDKLHFKLLASQAFRSPSIMDIEENRVALNNNLAGINKIEPEKTTVFEIEAGYKFNSNLFISANVFDITIDKPIIYQYDETNDIDSYYNQKSTGTRGFEAELKYTNKWINLNASYSHYMQADKNKVSIYSVASQYDKQALLGFARNKFTLNASLNIGNNLTVNPWLVYTGKKYGWTPQWDIVADDAIYEVNQEFDPTVILNLYINYNNLFIKKMSLGAGVYNLLDRKIDYVQPYLGNHAPIPGNSREILVKLSYNMF